MMPKFFNMFVGPLAAMFFVGMFLPRATARSVLPAALFGLVWPYSGAGRNSSSEQSIACGFALSIAVPCLSDVFFAFVFWASSFEARQSMTARYSWWAVVRAETTRERQAK